MVVPDIRHGIETPCSWDGLGRDVPVRGWCFDAAGGELRGVRVRVGEAVFKAKRKQTRFGVAQMFPGCEVAVKSGFSVDLRLPIGKSRAVFECRDAVGEWHVFADVEARVPWFPWRRSSGEGGGDSYAEWVTHYDTPDAAGLAELSRRSESLEWKPAFSVLMPTYNTPGKLLRKCLDSVLAQIYPHWELCVADDASPDPQVRKILEEYAGRDKRIRVSFRESNGHISAASNTALEMASGDFCALLDHDDELPVHALFWVADALQNNRDAVLVYSDEDKIDEAGVRQDPYFKTDWNPDLLCGQNCVSHLGVYRTEILRAAGGFRVGLEGSQDWDLALRVTANCRPDQIVHVPRILYHWRLTAGSTSAASEEKPYAETSGQRAVQEHLERTGQKARVDIVDGGLFRAARALPSPPPEVDIVVPTRDRVDVLAPCVHSLLEKTSYSNFGLVIVDNGSEDPATLQFFETLRTDNRVRLLRDDGEFNFSRLNNRAAEESTADILVLLNNDTEVIHDDWLDEMVSQALRPDTGAVGAKLLYGDGTVQHAGVFLGYRGAAGHLFKGASGGYTGHGQWVNLIRGVSAVTAACLAVGRKKYLEVGGMDEEAFAVAYNDVDFCLKLAASGYRNLYTPFARLYHYESKSRGKAEQTAGRKARANREIAELQKRWGGRLRRDPFYNPNLTLGSEDGGFASPPGHT